MTVIVTDEAVLRRLVADEVKRAQQPVLDALAHHVAGHGEQTGTLMTTAEVSGLLRIDTRTLRRLVHAGEVPAPISIGGRTDRWRRTTIESFLKGRERALTSGRT